MNLMLTTRNRKRSIKEKPSPDRPAPKYGNVYQSMYKYIQSAFIAIMTRMRTQMVMVRYFSEDAAEH